jgi:integrase
VFLYRYVLRPDLDLSIDAVRAKPSRYLPPVLTHDEAIAVIMQLSGIYPRVRRILYGSGLRLSEAL